MGMGPAAVDIATNEGKKITPASAADVTPPSRAYDSAATNKVVESKLCPTLHFNKPAPMSTRRPVRVSDKR